MTPEQQAALETITATMKTSAQALGAKVINAERELDTAFQNGTADEANIRQRGAGIVILAPSLKRSSQQNRTMPAHVTPAEFTASMSAKSRTRLHVEPYHRPVRRLILWLMVLLLPLRALAGDAMTVQMVTSQAPGQVEAAMPADCPMVAAGDHGAASDEAPSSCCNSCDLCLPLAEVVAVPAQATASAQHVMRPAPAVAALDVAPPPRVKPPIS